jgi:hypothetical protein
MHWLKHLKANLFLLQFYKFKELDLLLVSAILQCLL